MIAGFVLVLIVAILTHQNFWGFLAMMGLYILAYLHGMYTCVQLDKEARKEQEDFNRRAYGTKDVPNNHGGNRLA